jgi:LacI family transcriptional regulator
MPSRMTLTMKDIAAELGLSTVTISKAFRNFPDISNKTKARILTRAGELSFRPNLMARSLVTGRSSLVGLIVPDLVDPFYCQIAKSLSAFLREVDYLVILSSSENCPQLECDQIHHLLAHQLACLVVASCQSNPDRLKQIVESGVPLVLLNRKFENFSCNFVGVSDYRVGQLAAEHLVSQGFRRIAQIRGQAAERACGFQDTIGRDARSIGEDSVIFEDETRQSNHEVLGRTAMDEILNLNPRPDAVFCYNDTVAIAAMDRAFEAGLRIPSDIAFLGCGNFHYSDKLRVSLSSIDQKARQLGVSAAKIVLSMQARSSSVRIRNKILEPDLVVRESSRAN